MKASFLFSSSVVLAIGGLVLGAYVHPGFFIAEVIGAFVLWSVLD